MREIRSYGSGEVERVAQDGVMLDPLARRAVADWMQIKLNNGPHYKLAVNVDASIAVLGSVRAIGMTPSPEHGYDPIPLIRSGEKSHTLRGNARILGTVNQVAVNGTRIPLWVRWVARERVLWADVCTDEFARADGIRPVQGGASVAMVRLFEAFRGRAPQADDQMWLLHFEVFCDLMDELEGGWEL